MSSAQVSSICDVKEIPYIDTYMDIYMKKSASINLYPGEDDLNQLLIDVVQQYEWTHLTILYEAPFYSKRISKFLETRSELPYNIAVQPLDVGPGSNFHKELFKVKELNERSKNIIIESSIEHLSEILNQVKFINGQIVFRLEVHDEIILSLRHCKSAYSQPTGPSLSPI